MIYPYKCTSCKTCHEVYKTSVYASSIELCPSCGEVLQRVYTVPEISCTVVSHSKALGIDTSNKSAVKDMQKRYNDATGSNMIAIGNESPKVAQKKQSYDLPRELKAKIYAD